MKTFNDIKREAIALSKTHTLNAILDHLHAQGLLMVWQPMETAPKDGSFLVFYKGTILEAERSLDGVRSVNDQYGVIYYPKAWMPLPNVGELK